MQDQFISFRENALSQKKLTHSICCLCTYLNPVQNSTLNLLPDSIINTILHTLWTHRWSTSLRSTDSQLPSCIYIQQHTVSVSSTHSYTNPTWMRVVVVQAVFVLNSLYCTENTHIENITPLLNSFIWFLRHLMIINAALLKDIKWKKEKAFKRLEFTSCNTWSSSFIRAVREFYWFYWL